MAENRYQKALQVQDACNLTAVAGLFHEVCLEVLREGRGTDAPCKDPAVLMILDKINDLVGRPEDAEYNKAFCDCEDLSKKETA